MTTNTSALASVLAELEPRQVANDKVDREAWLRARLTGITATEAKELHIGSTRAKADVVRKKIEGDSFTGNRYTEWGNTREPAMLAAASAEPYGWLVHAPGNDRHLATPDGLRKTFDGFAVVECKTSKHDIAFGSPQFNDYGYLWQIVWQMYVTGTSEALYVWERHDDDWSRWNDRPMDRPEEWSEYGPKPIELRVEQVLLTPQLVAECEKMVAAADRALGRLDKKVAELKATLSAAPEVAPLSPEEQAAKDTAELEERLRLQGMETQARIWDEKNRLAAEAATAKDAAKAELLKLAEAHWAESDSHEFPREEGDPATLLRIGYSPESISPAGSVVDPEAAKAADPELWKSREAARIAFEAVEDQWKAHAANHTVSMSKKSPASVRVTTKKGKAE